MNEVELTDVVELLREGPSINYVPEQERNFDNKTMPTRHPLYHKGTTEIEGKVYSIVDFS